MMVLFMKALRFAAIGLLAVAGSLVAGVAWAQATPVDYAQRYTQACAACHGEAGGGVPGLAPVLAGQPSFYALTQLFLFRAGRRGNEAMTAVAKDMTDTDLRGFSELIGKMAAMPAAPVAQAPDAARMAQGRALAQSHMCLGCHGKDLAGAPQVPRLAGQHEDYLARTLQEFRSAKRVGYTSAMSEALSGLKPDELDVLAYYMARHSGNAAP